MKKQKKERLIKLNIDKRLEFSYKEPEVLKTCLNEQGMIIGRNRTGLPQKKQRQLTIAVKRARHLALLPFTPLA
jgi:small subunit ribosomal protein S18